MTASWTIRIGSRPMTKPKQPSAAKQRYLSMIAPEKLHVARTATMLAEKRLNPGDRVSRTLCAGLRGTFTFTGWDGPWACGKTVDDCAASSIIKINGEPVDFIAEAFAKIDGERAQ